MGERAGGERKSKKKKGGQGMGGGESLNAWSGKTQCSSNLSHRAKVKCSMFWI